MGNEGINNGTVATKNSNKILALFRMTLKQSQQIAIAIAKEGFDKGMIALGKSLGLHDL